MRFEAVVIDGGALIHSLIPKAEAVTFENYFTKHFLKHIELELRKTQDWTLYGMHTGNHLSRARLEMTEALVCA